MKNMVEQDLVRKATRQAEAANANGLEVEWHIAPKDAASEVSQLFKNRGVNVKVVPTDE